MTTIAALVTALSFDLSAASRLLPACSTFPLSSKLHLLYISYNLMRFDSHRLRFQTDSIQLSTKMPCPKRFAAALKETTTNEDGVKMYTWRAVRRQHLRMLRKQTRTIVLFMAIIEILRVGAPDIVYGGKHGTNAPGTEDYGVCTVKSTHRGSD